MITPNILSNREYLKIQSTAFDISDAVRMANELDVDNKEKAEARIQVYLSAWNKEDIKDLLVWIMNRESNLEYYLKTLDGSSELAKQTTLEIQGTEELHEKVNEAREHLPEIVW
ncbi:hypothetical protein [Exiguobacterium undae]|uniref:Uncharacterized protein n=1 Tax=Exiguobacterium undae TaxID=169177 RepID=A0ABX2V7T8_9BACL|nr:hypothetical protein [Exiguobacterium undae]OAN13876.1 hypothetical protein A3783_16400 [Exiguobacterium undae]